MNPTTQTQTVEDLGKLIKSKYPGSYDNLDDAELGRKVKTKYSGSYDQFIDTPIKPTAPETTFSKLKGAIYDPTIGSIGQGARDIIQPGSFERGAHEIISGAGKAAIPALGIPLVTNPVGLAAGLATGIGGQYLASHLAKGFGAGEDAQNLIGDVGGIAGGAAGGAAGEAIPEASRLGPAIKAAAPNMVTGLVRSALFHPLSGLRQVGRGMAEGAKELYKAKVAPPEAKTPIPNAEGMMNMYSALKGPKEPVGEVTPPGKGPSIGQLKAAVKNGTITPEQFDASVDKMPELNDEAKTLHKSDVRTSLAPKAKITPDEPKKTLSLSDMRKAVKNNLMGTDEYEERLAKAGYNEEDRGHLVRVLKKEMESEEGDKEEPKTETKTETKSESLKVEAPNKTPKKELKVDRPRDPSGKFMSRPITHEQAQDPEIIKALKPGARMTHKDGSTWTLKEVPIDKIKPDKGASGKDVNRFDEVKAKKLKGANLETVPHPEIKPNGDKFTVFEGHHRINEAINQGKKTVKAWVPEK